MATVIPAMSTTSQANDLHRFLPRSNLAKSFHHSQQAQRQPLRELDPAVHLAAGVETTTRRETGSTKKQKQEHNYSSALSRFRVKAKPVKSIDNSDAFQTRRPLTGAGDSNQSSPCPGPAGACARCSLVGCNCISGELWLPISENGNSFRQRNFGEKKNTNPENKRVMVKRSVSAVGEMSGRPGPAPGLSPGPGHSAQSSVHPSCISGQRLAEWKDPSRFAVEMRNDVIAKRLSLVEQRSRTPSGKIHEDPKGAADSAIRECLTVLGGSPYGARETEAPNDRSPLIELDRPPFAAAKNSFDNVAATDSSSDGRLPGQGSPGGGQSTTAALPPRCPPVVRVDGEPVTRQPTTPRAVTDARKKRWFPALRVKIPENEDTSVGQKLNLKKLSAADERKIEEVLELAGTFGRLGTSEHFPSTPRTPGASSKESHTGSCSDSPNSHFRFNFFKGRKEEKKTFAEELASHLTDPSSLLTPEALEAYEKLVSRGGGGDETEDSLAKGRTSKQPTRPTRRSGLVTKLLQRSQRNSLSESDKVVMVPENILQTKSVTSGSGRLMRFGSTGVTPKSLRTRTEPNLFAWFEKNPLNTTKSEQRPRPKSLQSDDRSGFNAFPLSMPVPSPAIQVPPRGGREKKVESTRRPPPPVPPQPTGDEPDAPPAIPPRIPRRQSTVSTANRPKHHKCRQTPKEKPRSYSEGLSAAQSTRLNLYDVPRRHVRSTDSSDGASISSEPQSPNARNPTNASLHSSDDSVFVPAPRSPHGPAVPPVRDPGPGASRGTKASAGPYRSMSVKFVNVKAKELGISDKNDPFWEKNVTLTLDLSESHSESDLLREALAPIPGRYKTSDCISYEDLMEFALDGPQQNSRNNNADASVCDEIRLMRKMFSNDVTVNDCMDALVETSWNVHHAVKLIKLKQLLGTGLGTQDQCKDALMECNWNVDEAAAFLLPPSTYN